jgi:hypothetical protein
LPNVTVSEAQKNCVNKTIACDLDDEKIVGNIYCKQGTLFSKSSMFCNSTIVFNATHTNETKKLSRRRRNAILEVLDLDEATTLASININETSTQLNANETQIDEIDEDEPVTILNCYDGQLPKNKVSFIPTTSTTTTTTTTTPKPPSNDSWVPEALTIPPEAPYEWMHNINITHENGTIETALRPVPWELLDQHFSYNDTVSLDDSEEMTVPPNWVKVLVTAPVETTTPLIGSSTSSDNQTEVSTSATEATKTLKP